MNPDSFLLVAAATVVIGVFLLMAGPWWLK